LNEDEAIKTVREAVRRGINYIDTAPFYGQGQSETILGKALKGIPREAYYIATKVARYDRTGEGQFDYSAKKTRESLERSLQMLGIDYVDVVQIHDIEFAPNLDVVINECLPEVEALKREGKTRNIGVSAYPISILKEIITRAPGRFNTVLSYARNTMFDDTLKEYIPFFQEQKLGIICASGHGCGILRNAGPQSWHFARNELKAACAEAAKLCVANKVELGKLAMYHFLQLQGPCTFLVGMETINLLDCNLDAYFNGLDPHEDKIYQEIMSKYFSKLTPEQKHWEKIEVEKFWADQKQS
jgi:L-galactose dehydrogenase